MYICALGTVSTLGGIYVLSFSGICVKGTYVCLMGGLLMPGPRGRISILMHRALHALRVSVFYRVLPVLNVMCVWGMVYAPGGGGEYILSVCTYRYPNNLRGTVIVPWGKGMLF